MNKYILLPLLFLGLLSATTAVQAFDGATDYGESSVVVGDDGLVNWTASVGEPSKDPFSPDSYKNAMGDTLPNLDAGGVGENISWD